MQELPTEAPQAETEPPAILLERFEPLWRLPEGCFGPSWHMKDRQTSARVVVRRLNGGASPTALRSSMQRIAETIGQFQNAVQILDVLEVDGSIWLARNWVHGENLDDALRALRILTYDQALLLIGAVCRGLTGVAGEQLVHGNLCPSNILIDTGGRVFVSDHGVRGAGARPGPRHMLHYLAPEVVAGGAPTARSDVYALGALLYVVLCGMYPLPFGADDDANMRILAAHNIVPPPKGVKLSGGIGSVVWQSFQPSPEDRYISVSAFLEALGRAQEREPSTFLDRLRSRLS